MATDVSKIKIGACKVTFDVDGTTPIVFETTQGGVTVNYSESSRETNIDQFGETAVKEVITGRQASIEVPFAEYDLEKLVKIIPGATLTTDPIETDKKLVKVYNKTIDLYSIAKKVMLEPLAEGATGNDSIILYKAAPRPNLSYSFTQNNELITNVTFKAFPDENNAIIGFGDKFVTVVE